MDKTYSVIADFSIIPLGSEGTSVGRYVAAAINAFKAVDGLAFEVTPMGTILAADKLEIIFEAVRLAHDALVVKGVKRVESTLRIDDRRDKQRTMHDKANAVTEYMREL